MCIFFFFSLSFLYYYYYYYYYYYKAVNAEALISNLEKVNGNTLSLFGEESGFLDMFGMQNGCGDNDSSVFCELANASNDFRRDTKEKRTCIKRPRVNVAVNFAPRRWLQFVQNNLQNHLLHRFHFCSPLPLIEQRGGVKKMADDRRESEFCMSALFLFVYNLNKIARMYEFESDRYHQLINTF